MISPRCCSSAAHGVLRRFGNPGVGQIRGDNRRQHEDQRIGISLLQHGSHWPIPSAEGRGDMQERATLPPIRWSTTYYL
jgi:hypothetical protein